MQEYDKTLNDRYRVPRGTNTIAPAEIAGGSRRRSVGSRVMLTFILAVCVIGFLFLWAAFNGN